MRAAVARRGVLVVEDVADPVAGPGDVLVAVKACGICGSDLHALHYADELVAIAREMGAPLAFDPARDFIMGHEFTGEVLELGPMTDGAPVKVGDLVTSLPVALTPTGMEPVGAYSNIYNGAYADRMRLSAAMCMKVPNGLDHRRAALTEPMAVGRHAVARVGDHAGGGGGRARRRPGRPRGRGRAAPPGHRDDRGLRLLAAAPRGRARDGCDASPSIPRSTIRWTRGRPPTAGACRWCSTRSAFPARSRP